MPVYKNTKNDTWYIRTYIKDINGKAKQITRTNKNWIGRDGKKKAEIKEAKIRDSYENVQEYINDELTVEELCSDYLDYISHRVRNSTYERYARLINIYVIPNFQKKKVKQLSNTDIEAWHNKIQKCTYGKSNKYLSYEYKRKIHMALSCALNYGCKYKGVKRNVARNAGNFARIRGTRKKEMNVMTIEEYKKFISYETNPDYKLFFTLLFYTGLRRGELFALRWEDINFKKGIISINKTLDMRKNSEVQPPKTDKSFREIKMLPKIYDLLKSIKKESGRLFPNENIKGTTLSRKCKANCKKAGIDRNIRIHDFRHSFATMCLDNGVPYAIISDYLGHENVSTTIDIYGHLYPDSQDILLKKLSFI